MGGRSQGLGGWAGGWAGGRRGKGLAWRGRWADGRGEGNPTGLPPPPLPPQPRAPFIQPPPPPPIGEGPNESAKSPPATSRALFPGFNPQPLGDGPLLAFLAGAAPPSLLAALRAFFPVEQAPPRDQLGEGDGPKPQAGDLDLGLELDADEDDEYLLS